MNNQNIGNSYSLMNYDLTIQLCKTFSLPLWYGCMLTAPRARNKDDSNMANYRLGSQDMELFDLMKSIYAKDEADVTEISNYLRSVGIDVKMITAEGNTKAGHYKIGNSPYFIHKERGHYFEGIKNLVERSGQQIIFLDPDTGIAPINQEISRTKGSSLLLTSEIRVIMNKVTDDSIIVIRQSMNNYFYKHEDRVKDLFNELQANVVLLVDEVIQSGLFIITKSEGMNKAIINKLQHYLFGYKSLRNSSRICLGYNEGDQVLIQSIDSFETEKQE